MSKLFTAFFIIFVATVPMLLFAGEKYRDKTNKDKCCFLMKGIYYSSKWLMGTAMQCFGACSEFTFLNNIESQEVSQGEKAVLIVVGGGCLYCGTKCKQDNPWSKAKENLKEALCSTIYDYDVIVQEIE